MFPINKSTRNQRYGLTLVELLVVIGILATIAALLVPSLRILNKDRNIRESGRVVASMIASASQRAVSEGAGGIQIIRNENIIDDSSGMDVHYAGTVMYVLRKVPAYAGDSTGALATIPTGGGNVVNIQLPWEYPDDTTMIQPNDFISFNYSSVRYRILGRAPRVLPAPGGTVLDITLDVSGPMPPLPQSPTGGDLLVPYVIHRQPRRLASSRMELPEGYIIDLRFSGEIYFPGTGGPLPDPRARFHQLGQGNISFIFNPQGGLDRYVTGAGLSLPPTQNQYLLVREYTTDDPSLTPEEILANPSNLWVTIGQQTGATNVANIRPIESPAGTLEVKINNARDYAELGESASQ